MPITELADADGHIIEPGDLWVERLPKDLRDDGAAASTATRTGASTSASTASTSRTSTMMYGGIRPSDMLQSMGLACAMGMPLERVFATDERERFTILDAPGWAMDGRERLAFNTENKVGARRAASRPSCSRAARSCRTSRPPSARSTTTGCATSTAPARAAG